MSGPYALVQCPDCDQYTDDLCKNSELCKECCKNWACDER